MREDIAILTGGKAITEDLGIKLENVEIEELGGAKKVTIDKDNTTIVAGAGKSSEIEGRVRSRVQIDSWINANKMYRALYPTRLAGARLCFAGTG